MGSFRSPVVGMRAADRRISSVLSNDKCSEAQACPHRTEVAQCPRDMTRIYENGAPPIGSVMKRRTIQSCVPRASQFPRMIWAEATDHSGRCSRAILSTPDPYDFTANSALEISSTINSLSAPLGLVTPVQAFGADFILTLPGCSRMDIPPSEMGSPLHLADVG
jgi:hypothetical protein